jgi:hypothetical protein
MVGVLLGFSQYLELLKMTRFCVLVSCSNTNTKMLRSFISWHISCSRPQQVQEWAGCNRDPLIYIYICTMNSSYVCIGLRNLRYPEVQKCSFGPDDTEIQLLGSNSSEKQQVRPPHARDCVFLNRSTCWYKGFTPNNKLKGLKKSP